MAIEGGDGKYGFLRWLMKEKPTLCMIGIFVILGGLSLCLVGVLIRGGEIKLWPPSVKLNPGSSDRREVPTDDNTDDNIDSKVLIDIKGKAENILGEPMKNVVVMIQGANRFSTIDDNGVYRFSDFPRSGVPNESEITLNFCSVEKLHSKIIRIGEHETDEAFKVETATISNIKVKTKLCKEVRCSGELGGRWQPLYEIEEDVPIPLTDLEDGKIHCLAEIFGPPELEPRYLYFLWTNTIDDRTTHCKYKTERPIKFQKSGFRWPASMNMSVGNWELRLVFGDKDVDNIEKLLDLETFGYKGFQITKS